MSQMCYMAGYGVKVYDLSDLLKEEYKELSSFELIDEIEKEDLLHLFCSFNGEDDYIYIPCVSPYEKSPFENIMEIDTYFYNKLKPFLKDDISKDHFSALLDDVFDWDYC